MKILIIDDVYSGDSPERERTQAILDALRACRGVGLVRADVLRERLPELGAAFKAELLRALEPPPVWHENYTERAPMRPSFCGFSGYDGRSAPTCWKGRGCASCLQKFKERQSRGRWRRGGRHAPA